jgi:purine-nucleoside phosphorylase
MDGDAYAPAATFRVVRALVEAANAVGVAHHVGVIATEDALYAVREDWAARWQARGVLAQEMEASAIFTVAALRGLEAGCVAVASNAAGEHERLPDDGLQPAIDAMIRVALDASLTLA